MKIQQIIQLIPMKLLLIKLFMIALIGVVISCSENEYKEYYSANNTAKIITHMETIGLTKDQLKDHVVLISRASACSPCLRELNWWDDNKGSILVKDVSLVLAAEYKMSSQAFIESQNIGINTYQDSSRTFLHQNILPSLPLKLYFNGKGKLVNMAPIGTDGNLDSFIERISQ